MLNHFIGQQEISSFIHSSAHLKTTNCVSGGTKPEAYESLPRPMVSRSGFQGCISSLETNGELIDPMRHALVPSPLVEEGCEGKFFV